MVSLNDRDEDMEWEAELFTMQTDEWMKDCPHKDRCPGARLFVYLKALMRKIERQQHTIKMYEDRTYKN